MGKEEKDVLVSGVMLLLRIYKRAIRKASNRLQRIITRIDKNGMMTHEIKFELIRIKEILDLVGYDEDK